jgi:hypothetical protein
MTTETTPVSPLRDGHVTSIIEWQASAAGTLLEAQQRQTQILLAWQKSVADIGQDLWDRWICRFGGGVPLDG